MGMALPLYNLRRVVTMLEQTWKAWFKTADRKLAKRLERNFEHLLYELRTLQGYAEEDWGFTPSERGKKKSKFDWKLHSEVVGDIKD